MTAYVRVTVLEVAECMADLLRHYGRPKVWGKSALDEVAAQWMQTNLRFLTANQLREAVQRYIARDTRFYPTVGQLYALASEAKRGGAVVQSELTMMQKWNDDPWAGAASADESTPCPVCQAVWTWQPHRRIDGTDGPARLTITHDAARHREANVPYSYT